MAQAVFLFLTLPTSACAIDMSSAIMISQSFLCVCLAFLQLWHSSVRLPLLHTALCKKMKNIQFYNPSLNHPLGFASLRLHQLLVLCIQLRIINEIRSITIIIKFFIVVQTTKMNKGLIGSIRINKTLRCRALSRIAQNLSCL